MGLLSVEATYPQAYSHTAPKAFYPLGTAPHCSLLRWQWQQQQQQQQHSYPPIHPQVYRENILVPFHRGEDKDPQKTSWAQTSLPASGRRQSWVPCVLSRCRAVPIPGARTRIFFLQGKKIILHPRVSHLNQACWSSACSSSLYDIYLLNKGPSPHSWPLLGTSFVL